MSASAGSDAGPRRRWWRGLVVGGVLAGGLGLYAWFGVLAPQRADAAAAQRFASARSLQEGVLAVPAEARRFVLEVSPRAPGAEPLSTLVLQGEVAEVRARNAESRGGALPVHTALAQLSGELAASEGGSWRVSLRWPSGRVDRFDLDGAGQIRPVAAPDGSP